MSRPTGWLVDLSAGRLIDHRGFGGGRSIDDLSSQIGPATTVNSTPRVALWEDLILALNCDHGKNDQQPKSHTPIRHAVVVTFWVLLRRSKSSRFAASRPLWIHRQQTTLDPLLRSTASRFLSNTKHRRTRYPTCGV